MRAAEKDRLTLSVCLIMGENLMLSTPFLQMFQGLRAFALPFRRLEKAVLRGAVRALLAGRFAASPHPKARTIQRPGKRVWLDTISLP